MISVTNNLAANCPIAIKDLQAMAVEQLSSTRDSNEAAAALAAKLGTCAEAANFKFFVTYTTLASPSETETVAAAHWDPVHDGTWTTTIKSGDRTGVVVVTWIKA